MQVKLQKIYTSGYQTWECTDTHANTHTCTQKHEDIYHAALGAMI